MTTSATVASLVDGAASAAEESAAEFIVVLALSEIAKKAQPVDLGGRKTLALQPPMWAVCKALGLVPSCGDFHALPHGLALS
jgi:hypothetical protein